MDLRKTWIFEPSEARTDRTLANNEVLQMKMDSRQGKVSGIAEVHVNQSSATLIGKAEDGLFCYKAKVRRGKDDLLFMDATVLVFHGPKNEDVATLHRHLCSFNHLFIMPSIGYGHWCEQQEDYIALPCFNSTMEDYLQKTCKKTVRNKRFTEEFSTLIGCVVRGLQELHDNGYYCPNLIAKFVAIVKQYDSICARLWYFCPLKLGNENEKDMDWVRLAVMIEKAARCHNSLTPEIEDLCNHMKNGTLKGLEILKQSALISVRAKFDNIVALNTVALTHCKRLNQAPIVASISSLHCSNSKDAIIIAMEQIYCNSLDKNKTMTSFEMLLDSVVGWRSSIPDWITDRQKKFGVVPTKDDTFRGFLWEIRCLYEHENKYDPPGEIEKVSSHETICYDEKPELESEVRGSWAYLFLVAQKFATSLQLEPC